MALWRKKQLLSKVAMTTLLLFAAVSFMHTFVPHDHPHDPPPPAFGLPVHVIAGEEYFLLLMLASLFIICSSEPLAFDPLHRVFFTAQKKKLERMPPNFFSLLFAKGILHSRAH